MIKKTSLLLALSRWLFALHGKEARNREPKQGKRKVTSEERCLREEPSASLYRNGASSSVLPPSLLSGGEASESYRDGRGRYRRSILSSGNG